MNPKLLAAGAINNPYQRLGGSSFLTNSSGNPGAPIFILLGSFFKMGIVIASLYALWNFLIAGYGFMSAGGDSKKVSEAWSKINQTIIGLVVAAGSVTIAGLIGYLVFNDATFLLTPRLITPT